MWTSNEITLEKVRLTPKSLVDFISLCFVTGFWINFCRGIWGHVASSTRPLIWQKKNNSISGWNLCLNFHTHTHTRTCFLCVVVCGFLRVCGFLMELSFLLVSLYYITLLTDFPSDASWVLFFVFILGSCGLGQWGSDHLAMWIHQLSDARTTQYKSTSRRNYGPSGVNIILHLTKRLFQKNKNTIWLFCFYGCIDSKFCIAYIHTSEVIQWIFAEMRKTPLSDSKCTMQEGWLNSWTFNYLNIFVQLAGHRPFLEHL